MVTANLNESEHNILSFVSFLHLVPGIVDHHPVLAVVAARGEEHVQEAVGTKVLDMEFVVIGVEVITGDIFRVLSMSKLIVDNHAKNEEIDMCRSDAKHANTNKL